MRFNAHHAPIGAYATFTLGVDGRGGGFDRGRPPAQPGRPDRVAGGRTGRTRRCRSSQEAAVRPLPVTREFGVTVDAWTAPGPAGAGVLAFRDRARARRGVRTRAARRPAAGGPRRAERRQHGGVRRCAARSSGCARRPASTRRRPGARRHGSCRRARRRAASSSRTAPAGWRAGSARRRRRARPRDSTSHAVLGGEAGGEGDIAALRFDVPAGRRATYRVAVAFWHGGEAAAGPGRRCSYWYTRLFDDLHDAASYALVNFERLAGDHAAAGAELDGLPEDRRSSSRTRSAAITATRRCWPTATGRCGPSSRASSCSSTRWT